MFQGGHIANPCFLVFLWDNLQSERQSLRIDISCFRTVSFCIVTFCRSQWSCEIFLKRQWICLFWGMPRARWRMNVNDDFKWSVVFCVFSASIQRVVRGGAHVTESFWLEANVIKSLSVWHFPSEIRQFGHFLVFFWGVCWLLGHMHMRNIDVVKISTRMFFGVFAPHPAKNDSHCNTCAYSSDVWFNHWAYSSDVWFNHFFGHVELCWLWVKQKSRTGYHKIEM